MFRFAANISTMFGEWSFLDRISAASRAGFRAIECQWPYEFDVGDVANRLSDLDMPLILLNAPKDDGKSPLFGMAAIPGFRNEFRRSVEYAAQYAEKTGCQMIHILAGVPGDTVDHQHCRDIYIDNIQWAATQLGRHSINVMLEAINTIDLPGYHIQGNDDLVDAIRATNCQNVRMQFDVYHSHQLGEDVFEVIEKCREFLGHVQVSGYPGRHEPVDGDIRFSSVFKHLDKLGYEGWVGCEYRPSSGTLDGLSWLEEYQSDAR